MRALPRQIGAFGLVGIAATILHLAVALACQRWLGLAPLAANGLAYAFAVLVSYAGHALVTFQARVVEGRQFARFVVVSLAGLAVGQAIVFVMVEILGRPFALAMILVASVVPALSFLASRGWAFGKRGKSAA